MKPAQYTRLSTRAGHLPQEVFTHVGFRLVLELDVVSSPPESVLGDLRPRAGSGFGTLDEGTGRAADILGIPGFEEP